MRAFAGSRPGDPAAFAGCGRDAAVEAGRQFQRDQRPAEPDPLEEAGIDLGGVPAGNAGTNETEDAILDALRARGRPMKGEPLSVKAVGRYNGHTKSTLASMVKRGLLTNNGRDGYALPEWDAKS